MALNDKEMCKLETECARTLAPSIDRANVLRYSAVRQILWGSVGGRKFGPVHAPSGAGQDGVTERSVSLAAWRPQKKAGADGPGSRGGTIVPGWWIVIPEELGKGEGSSWLSWGSAPTAMSLRVVPYALDASYSGSIRNSFYIHGTGGKGSDGCILVPPKHRHVLADWVCAAKGAWLHVFVSGIELQEAFERSQRANATA